MEQRLPWLQHDEDEDRLVFIIDNYLMSMYRTCPALFMLKAVEGWAKRISAGSAELQRNWYLDLGIAFHKMMELYYKSFREPGFDVNKFAVQQASEIWTAMNMDQHLGHKECQSIGGYPGFAGMLIQYAVQFKPENERLRVLATEVPFGKGREVPIYQESADAIGAGPFSDADIFLSGRLDIIADDGFFIFPLDHKTMGSFRGDPLSRFINDEGPTGYVFAMNRILSKVAPPELILKRQCNKISMNLISKAVPKEGSRFKRLMLHKSEDQLRTYRERVILTCNHILEDLEAYVRGQSVPRATAHCTNMYFHDCDFLDVHRQSDAFAEAKTLENGYIKLKLWDTESLAEAE
jgi:hypothetical protein